MFKIIVPVFIILIIFTFVFAIFGYPLFTDDAACFLPASYFINHDGKLINPFYVSGLDLNSTRLLFYPPLFPYVTSLMLKILPGNDNVMHIALSILDDLTIVIATAALYIYVRRNKIYKSWQTCLFIILWLLTFFGFQGVASGRPEILSKLFISCFLLNNVLPQKRGKNLVNGVIIGLNAITSPVSTFYLMLFYVCATVYKSNFKLKALFQLFIGLLLVFLVFISFYPYKITELIANMNYHSTVVVFNGFNPDFRAFLSNHILSILPFSILPFFVALIYVLYQLIKEKRYWVLCLVSALSIMVGYFSFKTMAMSYNLYVLTPIILFIIFVIYIKSYEYSQTSRSWLPKFVSLFIICMLALNSIGFARRIVVFSMAEPYYYSSESCRKNILNIIRQTDSGKKIAVSTSLWPLCLDEASNVSMLDAHKKTTLNPSIQYLILQQNYTGASQPVFYEHYKLIKNQFNINKVQIGSVTVATTYPGYQIAVYERQ